jgi:hypothetical protein
MVFLLASLASACTGPRPVRIAEPRRQQTPSQVSRASATNLHSAAAAQVSPKEQALQEQQRWYATLKDDSAGMGQWRQAALKIISLDQTPGAEAALPTNGPRRTSPVYPMRGRTLRSLVAPSVTDLMIRRALEVPAPDAGAYDLCSACDIALYLSFWEETVAAPVATKLVKRWRLLSEYSGQRNPCLTISRLTLIRVRAGDTEAFADYAAWLQELVPSDVHFDYSPAFAPLWQFPSNAVLQAAAQRLFGDTNSPWRRLPWNAFGFFGRVETNLVKLPAFRSLLVRELCNKDVYGTIDWRQNSLHFETTNGANGLIGGMQVTDPFGKDRPVAGTKSQLRWCDCIAWSLSREKQIPPFDPFAPVEKRDEVIRQAKALLEADPEGTQPRRGGGG